MAKARKLVVLTHVDGNPRQLLSIEERSSGDLTIILKRGLRGETYDGNDRGDVQQRKISLHRSPSSPTHNIVSTEVVGGKTSRFYAQIRPNPAYGGGVIWPAIAAIATNLPEDAYRPKVKQTDRVVDLGEMKSSEWTLFFFIIMRELNVPRVTHWCLNYRSILFSYFYVDVCWTYLQVPTTYLSKHLNFATKQPIIDGETQLGNDVIDAKCPAPYRLLELQDQALSMLSSEAVRHMVRVLREIGRTITVEEEQKLVARSIHVTGTMDPAWQ